MKRSAPATQRNREPIAEVLDRELPRSGVLLEIASGSGEHGFHLAGRFAGLKWQPSDPDPDARASIAAWRSEYPGENLMFPLELDAALPEWPIDRADAILCINMVHISPWEATLGLFGGAGRILAKGAPLILYGPFLQANVETAPSNLAFDEWLRARDARWGLRDTSDLDALAAQQAMARTAIHAMPANNIMLVYRKT